MKLICVGARDRRAFTNPWMFFLTAGEIYCFQLVNFSSFLNKTEPITGILSSTFESTSDYVNASLTNKTLPFPSIFIVILCLWVFVCMKICAPCTRLVPLKRPEGTESVLIMGMADGNQTGSECFELLSHLSSLSRMHCQDMVHFVPKCLFYIAYVSAECKLVT